MINTVWDWLEPEVLQEIKDRYENAKGTPSFEINNMGRWGKGLDSGSFAPVVILPLPEYEQYFLDKYKKLDPVFEQFDQVTVFLQIWPPGSQIGWHHDADDSINRIGSTVYLNETWNWNWGGLFLYDDPDHGQGWVFPNHNKMIWFVPPVWHATSMVGLNAEHPRISIQIFFTAPKT
jgi:Rps23 Pro-64 3,4-dihydroxylase Tpa1-like proline 4-hydroxylase